VIWINSNRIIYNGSYQLVSCLARHQKSTNIHRFPLIQKVLKRSKRIWFCFFIFPLMFPALIRKPLGLNQYGNLFCLLIFFQLFWFPQMIDSSYFSYFLRNHVSGVLHFLFDLSRSTVTSRHMFFVSNY
jgi:hypothetical protein